MCFLCIVKTISLLSGLETYIFECAGREEPLCRSHLREQVTQVWIDMCSHLELFKGTPASYMSVW